MVVTTRSKTMNITLHSLTESHIVKANELVGRINPFLDEIAKIKLTSPLEDLRRGLERVIRYKSELTSLTDQLNNSIPLYMQFVSAEQNAATKATMQANFSQALNGDDGLYKKIHNFQELKGKLEVIEITLNKYLEQGLQRMQRESNVAAGTGVAPVVGAGETRRPQTLPQLKIENFDGNPEKYHSFIGLFDAHIHNRADLSVVEKFSYLISYTSGEPKKLLTGLTPTAENYNYARDTLKKKYDEGGKALLINRCMTRLNNLRPVTERYTLNDLFLEVQIIFRELETAGVEPNVNEHCFHILKAIPFRVKAKIVKAQEKASDEGESWTLEKVIKILQAEIRTETVLDELQRKTKELRTESRSVQQIAAVQRPQQTRYNTPPPSRPLTREMGKYEQHKCAFCGRPHKSEECRTVSRIADRREKVRQENRCFRCLRQGHGVSDCRSQTRCNRCQASHHTALCEWGKDRSEQVSILARAARSPRPFYRSYEDRKSPQRSGSPHRQKSVHFQRGSRDSSREGQANRRAAQGQTNQRVAQKPALNEIQRARSPERGRAINVATKAVDRTGRIDNKGSQASDKSTHSTNSVQNKELRKTTGNVVKIESLLTGSYVKVEGQGDPHIIPALQDSGADISCVSAGFAKEAKLKPYPEEDHDIGLKVFGKNEQHLYAQARAYEIVLGQTRFGPSQELKFKVWAVPDEWFNAIYVPIWISKTESHLQVKQDTPKLLLGSDVLEFLWNTGRTVEYLPSGFLCMHTQIGPVVMGTGRLEVVNEGTKSFGRRITHVTPQRQRSHGEREEEEANEKTAPLTEKEMIDNFLAIERTGTETEPIVSLIDEDKLVEENFHRTTARLPDGRYEVELPTNENVKALLPNYRRAQLRLQQTLRKLITLSTEKQDFVQIYHEIIMDQLEKGIIEPCSLTEHEEQVHYLAHSCVINETKQTTRVRIVYDGSQKCAKSNLSLNNCLFKGPIRMNDMTGLVLRFRTYKYVVCTDVVKAFLGVSIAPKHRDLLRFIWVKTAANRKGLESPENEQLYRFARMPFGLNCSPYLLQAVVLKHLEDTPEYENTRRMIQQDLFADNILLHGETPEEPLARLQEAIEIFERGQLYLQEFTASSAEVQTKIQTKFPENKLAKKYLGIEWNTGTDKLTVHTFSLPEEDIDTKRKLLKLVAQTFDPAGWMAPLSIPLRLEIQKLWLEGKKWDQKLEPEKTAQIREILCKAADYTQTCPRFLNLQASDELELIIFCDASEYAYGAVAYIRQTNPEGKTNTHMVFAKGRIAPTKKMTIPRLELSAILIGSRVDRFLRQQLAHLSLKRTILFSDSRIAIHWVKNTKEEKLDTFVNNRRREILSSITDLRHIAGAQNPADLVSRGCDSITLSESTLWAKGPDFLQIPEAEWPKDDRDDAIERRVHVLQINRAEESASMAEQEPVIDLSKYRSLYMVLGIVIVILTYFKSVARAVANRGGRKNAYHKLKSIDMANTALRALIRQEQQRFPPNAQLEQLFHMWKDEHSIIRCTTRLEPIEGRPEMHFPVYLPHESQLASLLALDIHEKRYHCGVSQILATLREHYYLTRGRSVIKRVLKSCRHCRREAARAYQLPEFGTFPSTRTKIEYPFTYVGTDLVGPFTVIKDLDQYKEKPAAKRGRPKKETEDAQDANTRKIWVIIFVCLTTRAIHLDVISEPSAIATLRALRRFIARRGRPKQILSDQGRNFVLTGTVTEYWRQQYSSEITNYCAQEGITWNYTTVMSPWKGASYERQNLNIRRHMRAALGRTHWTYEEFLTILVEIEAVINNRPLTAVTDGNEYRVLRPVDFLMVNNPTGCPHLDEELETEYSSTKSSKQHLLVQWQRCQKKLNYFWTLFQQDYIPMLRDQTDRKHKHQGKQTVKRIPQKGEVVIIFDEPRPRAEWKLGKIVSCEAPHRNARVLLANGNEGTWSIKHLYPLEVAEQEEEWVEQKSKTKKKLEPTRQYNLRERKPPKQYTNQFVSLVKTALYCLVALQLITPVEGGNQSDLAKEIVAESQPPPFHHIDFSDHVLRDYGINLGQVHPIHFLAANLPSPVNITAIVQAMRMHMEKHGYILADDATMLRVIKEKKLNMTDPQQRFVLSAMLIKEGLAQPLTTTVATTTATSPTTTTRATTTSATTTKATTTTRRVVTTKPTSATTSRATTRVVETTTPQVRQISPSTTTRRAEIKTTTPVVQQTTTVEQEESEESYSETGESTSPSLKNVDDPHSEGEGIDGMVPYGPKFRGNSGCGYWAVFCRPKDESMTDKEIMYTRNSTIKNKEVANAIEIGKEMTCRVKECLRYRIRLYDGTIGFVPELELRHVQTAALSQGGRTKQGNTNEMLFVKTNDVIFAVAAYGIVRQGQNAFFDQKSINVSMKAECTHLGIKLKIKHAVDIFTICFKGRCFTHVPEGKTTTHEIEKEVPIELLRHPSTVHVRAWREGHVVSERYLNCQLIDPCENLQWKSHHSLYIACHKMMFTYIVLVGIFLTAVGLGTAIFLLMKRIRTNKESGQPEEVEMINSQKPESTRFENFKRSARERISLLKTVRKSEPIQEQEEDPEDQPSTPKANQPSSSKEEDKSQEGSDKTEPTPPQRSKKTLKRQGSMVMESMFIILYLITSAQACTLVSTITAKESECKRIADHEICKQDEAIQLYLQHMEQGCIRATKEGSNAMKTLEVEAYIEQVCKSSVGFFTRAIRYRIDQTKRCSGMGSCTENKCAETTPWTVIPELQGEDKSNHTAIYGCVESCGGVFCGCLFSPSCIFYKATPIAESDEVYRLFSCNGWTEEVVLKVTVHDQQKTTVYNKRITIGARIEIEGFHISAVTAHVPPVHTGNEHFISDGRRVAYINEDQRKMAHTLRCSCEEVASRITGCEIDEKACECHPADEKAKCRCDNSLMLKSLWKKQSLPAANDQLHPWEDSVKAIPTHSAVQLEVTASSVKFQEISDDENCDLQKIEVSGCYSCLAHASLHLVCKSKSRITAFLECPSFSTLFVCGDLNATVNKIAINTPTLDEQCTLICNEHTSTIHIQSFLHVSTDPIEEHNYKLENVSKDQGSVWGTIWNYFVTGVKWIAVGFIGWAGFVMIICFIGLIIFIICYLKINGCCC